MTHTSPLNIPKLLKKCRSTQEHYVNLKRHYLKSLKRVAKKLTRQQLSLLGGKCVCRDGVMLCNTDSKVRVPKNPGPSGQ